MAATKTTKTTVKKTATKPAAKKPAAKKAAPAKKAPAQKTPVKKAAAPKKATAAKTPVKKAPAKPAAKAAPKKATPTKTTKTADPIKAVALALEKTLDTNKAQEIVTIDLKGRSALADWMIVASGTSARQVAALANYVQHEFAKQGYKRLRIEGMPQADWVIVDSGDVVIHLFRPEVRDFYQLERLWSEDEAEPNKRISLR